MAERKSNSKKDTNVNALITLLEDPDKEVFQHVFNELTSMGQEVIPKLETQWEDSNDPILHGRIEDVIHNIQFKELLLDFKNWLKTDPTNLLQGILLVNKYRYPELDFEKIRAKIDVIKQDIWLEINDYMTALEKIKVINHIIYSIHKFHGDEENHNSPTSNFMGNLIDSKKGNSVSLGILYLVLAKELEIPIYGVNLPHHFILAYVDIEAQNLLLFDEEKREKVLFYINPFNEGAIFTRKEIGIYLEKLNVQKDPKTEEFDERYFSQIRSLEVVNVLITQLMLNYQSNGAKSKMDDLEQLQNILLNFLHKNPSIE